MTNDNFEVGDWVVFSDACKHYPDLHAEEDWSAVDGLIGIVTDKIGKKLEVQAVFGKWPCENPMPELDRRHFTVFVKNSEIVLDAPFKPVLDSAHAPKED